MNENNKYNLDGIIEKNYSIKSLELYLENSLELRDSLKEYISKYPNNMDLGKNIRRLYHESISKK